MVAPQASGATLIGLGTFLSGTGIVQVTHGLRAGAFTARVLSKSPVVKTDQPIVFWSNIVLQSLQILAGLCFVILGVSAVFSA